MTSMPGQAASAAAKRTQQNALASGMPAGRRICTPYEGSLSDLAGDGSWAHFALPVLDVSSAHGPAGGREVGLNIGSVAGCGGLGLPASAAGRTFPSPVAFCTDVGVRARGGHVGAPGGRFRDGLPSGCGSSINRVLSGYRSRPPVACDMVCGCCPRRQWPRVSCGHRPGPAPELSCSQLAKLVSRPPAIQTVCSFGEGRQGKSRGPEPRPAAVRA
jgi:hypothetical protein